MEMLKPEELQKWIREELGEDAEVFVQDRGGDGYHYEVVVVSAKFEGLTQIQSHQRVYKALGPGFQGQLHAVTLKTMTPLEWERFS